MKIVKDALTHILRTDPIVQAYVGRDSRDQPRVYEDYAPKDELAPYVVWHLMAGGTPPEGTYGDDECIENVLVQVASWGRNYDEAWSIYGIVHDALRGGNWNAMLAPYELMLIKRMGDQFTVPDADTNWVQVPVTYRLSLGR
jgi:hypothetical protein